MNEPAVGDPGLEPGASALRRPRAALPALGILRRAAVVDVIAIGCLALLMRLIFHHAEPDTDPTYALLWGRDILHGHLPNFAFPSAPTAHPLPLVEAVLVAPLGRVGAASAFIVSSYLCLGWILWGAFRLGEATFSRPVGLLALALVGINFATVDVGLAAFLDVQFIALAIWAMVLEARRPQRGASVLALLTIAGLLRPEGWILAAAYWLYAYRRRDGRAVAALAVVAAPLGWILMDWIVTGHPLFAFSNARQSSEGVALRGASNSSLVTLAVNQLRNAMRAPVLVAGAIGVLAAVRWAFRASRTPLAVLLLLLLMFGAFIVLRLPVPDRMLGTPAVIVAVFASYGALGWLGAGGATQLSRRLWTAVGLALLVLLAATVPGEITRLQQLNHRRAVLQRALGDLRSLGREPVVAHTLASCRTLSAGASEIVPYAAYYLDRPLGHMRLRPPEAASQGAYITLTSRVATPVLGGFQVFEGTNAPPGFGPVASNGSWRLYKSGC